MFSFVGGPYTDNITTITAATMNYLRGSYANAWDIIGGGTYTPTTQTELTGTIGLKTNFSATGLQVAGLGGLHILSGSTGYVDSGGFLTVSSGGVATITGTMTTSGAGAITIANGGDLFIASGGEETVQSGGLLTAAAGSTVTLAGTSTVSGAMTVNATGTLTTNAASTSTFAGPITSTGENTWSGVNKHTARTVRRVPAFLTDADQTVDTSQGNIFILADNPAASRVITIRQSTAPVPENGDWMRFFLKLGASPFTYDLRREGSANTIVYINGYVGATYAPVTVELQLIAGVWRLVEAGSGSLYSTDA